MAIIKNCTNMKVRVGGTYQLLVGQNFQKLADKINVEARKKSLTLASNKQVLGQGGKSS
ncbi:hypothetical protein AAFN85_17130 [Mucilaginibacter sp. CAU 1740]|jgi:hypothetical protein|uniref:hypothetical protein n=1 Tax=Mucilaginibacter sp. CAU 1740 TaxID=3140365 RepID=UPI00325B73D1